MYPAVVLRTIGLALLALALSTSGCKKDEDPAAVIKALIERTAKAAEAKDLSTVMELLSERAKARSMDKKEIKRFVFAQMRSAAWRKVFLVRTEVALQDDSHATAKTTAVLSKGEKIEKAEDAIPRSVGAYKIDLKLEKEEDTWRAVEVAWSRVTDPKALVGLE